MHADAGKSLDVGDRGHPDPQAVAEHIGCRLCRHRGATEEPQRRKRTLDCLLPHAEIPPSNPAFHEQQG
jgi:hypothetical protein